jgi:hypothetical protein
MAAGIRLLSAFSQLILSFCSGMGHNMYEGGKRGQEDKAKL